MEITLDRAWKKDGYTISRLFIGGERICEALEDTDRGLKQSMSLEELKKLKIYGKTAIPSGRYRVVMSYSPKFKEILPRLQDVPNYAGILIHRGNTAKDTCGCILPGKNVRKGAVLYSTKWTNVIISEISSAIKRGEEVWINIE